MNSVPYEVIAAPYVLWLADVGTTFPTLDEEPDDEDWMKVGTSGDLNYDDGTGVTIQHAQTMTKWRATGDAGTRKVFRNEEDQIVRLKLVDVTLEQYALALNHNAITTVAAGAGTAGYKWIGLSRGFQVTTKALLIRGTASPYGATYIGQYEIPVAVQFGSPTVMLTKKGEPAGLDLEWHTLVDPSAATEYRRFGRLLAQHAAPTS